MLVNETESRCNITFGLIRFSVCFWRKTLGRFKPATLNVICVVVVNVTLYFGTLYYFAIYVVSTYMYTFTNVFMCVMYAVTVLVCIWLRLDILHKADELLKTRSNDHRWSFGRMFVQDLPWRHHVIRHIPVALQVAVAALWNVVGNDAASTTVSVALFSFNVGITCKVYGRSVLKQSGCKGLQKVTAVS